MINNINKYKYCGMNGRLIGVKLALGFVKFEANKKGFGLLAISREIGLEKPTPSLFLLSVQVSQCLLLLQLICHHFPGSPVAPREHRKSIDPNIG